MNQLDAWVVNDLWTFVLLILTFVISKPSNIMSIAAIRKAGYQNALYTMLNFELIISVSMEAIQKAHTFGILGHLCNYALYITDPILYVTSFIYVTTVMGSNRPKWMTKIVMFGMTLTIINFVVLTVDLIVGDHWFYTDMGTYYSHGMAYYVRAAVWFFYNFIIAVSIIITRKNVPKHYRKIIVMFPLIVSGFASLQMFFTGFQTQYIGYAVAEILLLVTIQRNLYEHDEMTNLYNRKYIIDKIQSCLDEDGEFTIVMCDVDKFKSINDTYGHLVGDDAIVTAGHHIAKFFGYGNTARYGGDEFLIVLDGDCGQQVLDFINNDRVFCFRTGDVTLNVSISVGCYVIKLGHKFITVDEAIMEADEDMYNFKQEHRE